MRSDREKMSRKRSGAVRARIKRNWIIAFFVGTAVVFFCGLMLSQIIGSINNNAEKEARKARLEEQIELEEQRRSELDDEEAYIKTREYIEEKAKSIGYVYPDEIIFKRED